MFSAYDMLEINDSYIKILSDLFTFFSLEKSVENCEINWFWSCGSLYDKYELLFIGWFLNNIG